MEAENRKRCGEKHENKKTQIAPIFAPGLAIKYSGHNPIHILTFLVL